MRRERGRPAQRSVLTRLPAGRSEGNIPVEERIEAEGDEDAAGDVAEERLPLRHCPELSLNDVGGIGDGEHGDGEPERVESEQEDAPEELAARPDHGKDARQERPDAGDPDHAQRQAQHKAAQPSFAAHPDVRKEREPFEDAHVEQHHEPQSRDDRGARSLEVSRALNPELQSFAAWLGRNGSRIPLA